MPLNPEEPVWSVGDLTNAVKGLLESHFERVAVRGEVSNLRVQASGHCYFTLKDDRSQISAVLFRGDTLRQNVTLADGMSVVCLGNLSVYPPRGNYQLIARVVLEEGAGRLQRRFEALKAALAAEGLFDAARKRPLPTLPRRVGILTSPTGAALRDFISILRRRDWRGRVRLFPAVVQGIEAVPSMLAMLDVVRRGGARDLDLLVIGRGGGSLEDLWAFNEEALVRALVNFPVPVISAVGHEIDFVLTDFVADRRAETPSAAAELISSLRLEALQRFERAQDALVRAADHGWNDRGQMLDLLAARLRSLSPENRFGRDERRLARLVDRLSGQMRAYVQSRRRRLHGLEARWRDRHPAHAYRLQRQRLDDLERRLRAAGVEATLKRGFALVRDGEGRVVSKVAGLRQGDQLSAEFRDGKASMRLLDTEVDNPESE